MAEKRGKGIYNAIAMEGGGAGFVTAAGTAALGGRFRLAKFALVCLLCAGPCHGFDHSGLDAVLKGYVNEEGRVDYTALQENRTSLDAYVEALAAISPKNHPDAFPSRDSRLAYWINAYNALVLRGVIDAYPVNSVKDIKILSGFFNRTWYSVGGESYTLNDIEHDILRDEYAEPRIHAAINCASIGCPKMESSAFFPHRIDARLEEAMHKFLNEQRNVTIDETKRIVTLSKVLDWFESDFTGWYQKQFGVERANILDYVALYVNGDRAGGMNRTWSVAYHDYDWSLNDVEKQKDGP